jgi:hypothetical protein
MLFNITEKLSVAWCEQPQEPLKADVFTIHATGTWRYQRLIQFDLNLNQRCFWSKFQPLVKHWNLRTEPEIKARLWEWPASRFQQGDYSGSGTEILQQLGGMAAW